MVVGLNDDDNKPVMNSLWLLHIKFTMWALLREAESEQQHFQISSIG